jgi:hypothetical protein
MRARGGDVDYAFFKNGYDFLKLLSERCLCNYRYISLEVLLG